MEKIKNFLKHFRKNNNANNGADSSTSTNSASDDYQELVLDYPSHQHHEQVKDAVDDNEQKEMSKPNDGPNRDKMIDMDLKPYFANERSGKRKSGTKVTEIERD